jgi:hypothetical protein
VVDKVKGTKSRFEEETKDLAPACQGTQAQLGPDRSRLQSRTADKARRMRIFTILPRKRNMLTEDLAGDLQDNAGFRMHDNV